MPKKSQICNYTSWNIENLSAKHMKKQLYTDPMACAWIASLLKELLTDLLGIMEVTLGTGEEGVQLICNAVKAIAHQGEDWKYTVTERNVDVDEDTAARADKYALVWDDSAISIENPRIMDEQVYQISFPDRVPMQWQINDNSVKVNCLLWHAPQPKYHLKDQTIELIARLSKKVETKTSIHRFLISGDFNFDTASVDVYKPLTDLGFDSVFDGEGTTLTSFATFLNQPQVKKQLVEDEEYDDAFLASAYDNVFLKHLDWDYAEKTCVPYAFFEVFSSGAPPPGTPKMKTINKQLQEAMKQAKIISDHMPLSLTILT